MKFELLPVADLMLYLYSAPLLPARFEAYLALLQGNTKGDMALPLGGFNPMAKAHAVARLRELKDMGAEQITGRVLDEVNSRLNVKNTDIIKVSINLCDDLMGGWTNRYTSDYDSKFKISGLINRRFCVPVFWTSEVYTEAIIMERVRAYVYRTIYWLEHAKPHTLGDHIMQETFVCSNIRVALAEAIADPGPVDAFYKLHKDSREYALIFNFLYGDAASKNMGFPTYGIEEEQAGFKYAFYKKT